METHTEFTDGRLIVTRVYAAPRDLVFEAWVETSKVQQWWGCDDTTAVRSEIEPKVGGCYNHHMTIKHAGEVPSAATFTEFDPPSRLAFESPAFDGTSTMRVTVEFTDEPDGTRVRLVHEGIPDMRVQGEVELRTIVRGGWTAAFRKLGEFLAVTPSP